jgi:hypothetical protein
MAKPPSYLFVSEHASARRAVYRHMLSRQDPWTDEAEWQCAIAAYVELLRRPAPHFVSILNAFRWPSDNDGSFPPESVSNDLTCVQSVVALLRRPPYLSCWVDRSKRTRNLAIRIVLAATEEDRFNISSLKLDRTFSRFQINFWIEMRFEDRVELSERRVVEFDVFVGMSSFPAALPKGARTSDLTVVIETPCGVRVSSHIGKTPPAEA